MSGFGKTKPPSWQCVPCGFAFVSLSGNGAPYGLCPKCRGELVPEGVRCGGCGCYVKAPVAVGSPCPLCESPMTGGGTHAVR